MEDYTFLLLLALILLSTKVFGLATEKIHMPQVVGALLAGIILGPSGLGVLESTDFLTKTAEIGVIMLMFTAGIDTDLQEVKQTGKQAFVIACTGVFVPLILCGGLYFLFFSQGASAYDILKAAFVGCVFAATSGVAFHLTASGSCNCVAVSPLVNWNMYSFTTPGVSAPSVSVSDATSPHL